MARQHPRMFHVEPREAMFDGLCSVVEIDASSSRDGVSARAR